MKVLECNDTRTAVQCAVTPHLSYLETEIKHNQFWQEVSKMIIQSSLSSPSFNFSTPQCNDQWSITPRCLGGSNNQHFVESEVTRELSFSSKYFSIILGLIVTWLSDTISASPYHIFVSDRLQTNPQLTQSHSSWLPQPLLIPTSWAKLSIRREWWVLEWHKRLGSD